MEKTLLDDLANRATVLQHCITLLATSKELDYIFLNFLTFLIAWSHKCSLETRAKKHVF